MAHSSSYSISILVLCVALPPCLASKARPLITQKIDESKVHKLAGNTRPEATAANDQGAVSDDLALDHILLQLQRPAEREQAVRQFVDELHDPNSPNYHNWLSPSEFGQAYGPSQEDVAAITNWLQSHGFSVNSVYPNGMVVDFSGTARQIRDAFQTEIHELNVKGQKHFANMSDPVIPAALAPAVAGVVSMHSFRPHAMSSRGAKYTYTSGTSAHQALVPGDLATIYNLTPLFQEGYTGKGQTIAVIEDSDLYRDSDWTTFRTTFGLSRYTSGTLSTVHPAGTGSVNNCAAPGVVGGDDGEAILDAEWASAGAPDAAILVASCASTRSTFGGLIALQNLINSDGNRPSVVSISYGECEAISGAAANAAFSAAYQQAVSEGISVFVSAGDEGAASCDAGAAAATHGIGVSGWAATPYNVAVGGTDFGDSYQGTNSLFWNTENNADFSSAKSYIPEIPWNDSCASSLLAGYFGFATPYGTGGFCDSTTAKQKQFVQVAAGSGGPSGCATGTPATRGIVGGTCQGYAKPAWQSGVAGIPQDGVRDIPDVSLFSGAGTWGHYYVTCWSNIRAGGKSCDGDPNTWDRAGGTSFSSPIMAGIQALINQKTGSLQGNPNYVYYKLAAQAYASTGANACNSANGSTAASNCIFYNITAGDIDVNCGGTQNCFGSVAAPATNTGRRGAGSTTSSGNGALSTSAQSYSPAYGTASGWNFATGIGSLNAYNLAANWNSGK